MSQPVRYDPNAVSNYIKWTTNPQNCYQGTIDPAGAETHYILPAAAIREHLTANQDHHLRVLLLSMPHRPQNTNPSSDIKQGYLAVFTILLHIGKGHLIDKFVEYESLKDTHLPFSPTAPPNHFPSDPGNDSFFQSFCEHQSSFCAPIFQSGAKQRFPEDRVLPFTVLQRLAQGGSATLYKIKFHADYDRLSSQTVHSDSREPGIYVLKTYYGSGAKSYYESEIESFVTLRDRQGGDGSSAASNIIRYHGAFKQGDRYNLVLEYADAGTLENFFKNAPQPTTSSGLIAFWKQFFKLIEALHVIHNGCTSPLDPTKPLYGWHQDVSPRNILLSSRNGSRLLTEFLYEFKLADLGIAHFQNCTKSVEEHTAQDTKGTRTYGAPECCRTTPFLQRADLDVTQAIDIWSLGAVFSEAVVWTMLGYPGLEQYRKDRTAATTDIGGLEGIDCFHDGTRCLKVVHAWHQSIRERAPAHATITERILVMVEDEMLCDVRDRSGAAGLCKDYAKIIRQAELKLERDRSGPPDFQTQWRQPPPSLPDSSQPSSPFSPSNNGNPPDAAPHTNGATRGGLHFSSSMYPQRNIAAKPYRQGTADGNGSFFGEDIFGSPGSTMTERQASEKPGLATRLSSTTSRNLETWQAQDLPGAQDYRSFVTPENFPNGQEIDVGSGSHGSYYPGVRREATFPMRMSGGLSQERDIPPVNPYRESRPNVVFPGGSYSPSLALDRQHSIRHRNATVPQPDFHPRMEASRQYDTPTLPGRPSPSIPEYYGPNENQGPVNSQVDRIEGEPTHNTSFPRRTHIRSVPKHSRYPFPMSTAVQWKHSRKSLTRMPWKPKEALPGAHLLKSLKNRDHVFIIDNSFSMARERDNLIPVFGVLAYILKEADQDGLDLYFTCSDKVFHGKSSSQLTKEVKANWSCGGQSDMKTRLESLLTPYKEKLKACDRYHKGDRYIDPSMDAITPITFYILTGGQWADACQPDQPIQDLVALILELEIAHDQVGIQFIGFGNDQKGLENLHRLDDDLLKLDIDIVDYTHHNGDTWKMLHGATDKGFDHSE